MKKPLGIIFDCDGCLLDSEKIFLESVVQYLHKYNIDTNMNDLTSILGKPISQIADDLISMFHLNVEKNIFIREEREIFSRKFEDSQLEPMPGLVEFLRNTKKANIKIAIASSSSKTYVKNVIQKLGIAEFFDVIVNGEEVEHGKPFPDIYLLAANLLDLPKKDLVIIEDSHSGIEAGKSSGIFTIGYKGSVVIQNTENADICIESYNQLIWE